jgi:hypothetical protein
MEELLLLQHHRFESGTVVRVLLMGAFHLLLEQVDGVTLLLYGIVQDGHSVSIIIHALSRRETMSIRVVILIALALERLFERLAARSG